MLSPWPEAKALARVRTPAGRDKYGQEIGEVIRRDVMGLLDPSKVDRGKDVLSGGRVAQTRRFRTPEGNTAISKVMADDNMIGLPARHQADAEYLVSLVGHAVSALVPNVYQIEDDDEDLDLEDFDFDDPDAAIGGTTEIWMNDVPGIPAILSEEPDHQPIGGSYVVGESRDREYFVHDRRDPRQRALTRMFRERHQAAMAVEELVQRDAAEMRRRSDNGTDDERLLGLLDLLVYNADRNRGNWMVTPDDRIVGIDHGGAFADQVEGRKPPIGVGQMGGVGWPRVLGWFSEHFYAPRTDFNSGQRTLNPSNDMSPHDMELIEQALHDIRSEFQLLGRMNWYSQMMRRFELLKARAHGTVDRLQDEAKWLIRRVRTEAGKKKYGQEIGEIIHADLVRLLQEGGLTEVPSRHAQGMISQTWRERLPDGSEGFHKKYGEDPYIGTTAEHAAHAEVLTSLVAAAVGALAPRAYLLPSTRENAYNPSTGRMEDQLRTHVWMNAVPGSTATEFIELDAEHPRLIFPIYSARRDFSKPADDNDAYFVREIRKGVNLQTGMSQWQAEKLAGELNEREKRLRGMEGDDDERLLGLLDIITINQDRNYGNWLITEDDRVVGIDHGRAFVDMEPEAAAEVMHAKSVHGDHLFIQNRDGWFSLPFLGRDLGDGYRSFKGVPNDMSPHDMDLIREALEGIETEFRRLDRLYWYEEMMRRFEVLALNAQGTRDRLEDPE